MSRRAAPKANRTAVLHGGYRMGANATRQRAMVRKPR